MKILIVYTNTYRAIAAAPLGASLVAARLRRDGHEVWLLDLMFAKSPAEEAVRVAREFRPDLLGFSIRNVDSQSYTDFFDPFPTIVAIVSAVREACPAPTLLGGTAFSSFPRQYLKTLHADYGIAGDDLGPISRFVASLAAGKPDLSLPGLVYRDGNEVRCNPFEIRGYADTAFDGWDLLDLRPYRRHLGALWEAAVVTRTGCPFCCVFCDTYRTFGRRWVPRDPRQVAEDLVALRRIHGARSVFLADAGFNRPLDHAKAVLEAIVAAQPGIPLTAIFEPGEMDDEFAGLFRRAGGSYMLTFATSLSDPVLAAQRKPFRLHHVLDGQDVLRRAKVGTFLYLTFGGPGETQVTVEETLRNADRLRPLYTLMDHGFRVNSGTALHETAVSQGVVNAEDDCFKATFYRSPSTPASFLDARFKRYRAEHRWAGMSALGWGARLLWDKWRP